MNTWLVLVILCASFGLADEKPRPTIAIPEMDQLQWSNLTLQAANLRLQAEALDAKANAKLTEIKNKLAGLEAEHYDFELNNGKIQLVRREKSKEAK